jgi:hypothetical protein
MHVPDRRNESGHSHMYNITPKDRIIERSRGCWSCTAYDLEGNLSIDKWNQDRERNLASAMETALEQPDTIKVVTAMQIWAAAPQSIQIEETDVPAVKRIKTILRMVDKMDHAVAAGAFRLCSRSPAPADRHGADFFSAKYLCSGWCGRDGHSVATEGAPLDKLPDELREEKK